MRYSALNREWRILFPFAVRREIEERYGKGWYGVCRMAVPVGLLTADLDKIDEMAVLDLVGEVREGVLVDLLRYGTEGMTEEQAVEAYGELGMFGAIRTIFTAINQGEGEAGDEATAPLPPTKGATKKSRRG